jgi:hypothetical protein
MTFVGGRRGARALAVLVALGLGLALVGCGTKVTPGPPVTRSYAPPDLVLQVDPLPGFGPAEWMFTHTPIISVYGDGRVITTGPTPAIFPGPALPSLLIQQIPTSDVRRLADRARAAGVGSNADLGRPAVADAGSMQFTLLTDTGVVRTTAYALGDYDDPDFTSSQRAARQALQQLVDDLRNLGAVLGSVPAPNPYTPAAVAAIAQEWRDPGDPGLPAPPPVAWPGPALPGQSVLEGLGCAIATGATAGAVLAAAAHANTRTPWTFGGRRWTVTLRPLLPDESTCADLR